jgi:hypothetical protein
VQLYRNVILEEEVVQKKSCVELECNASFMLESLPDVGETEDFMVYSQEEKEVLTKETVDQIMSVRCKEAQRGDGANKRKPKAEQWSPVLVERQRRRKDTSVSMLQRAMNLKQRKNLEPFKGNPFDSLESENLQELASDVNVKLGRNSNEAKFLADNPILEGKICYE